MLLSAEENAIIRAAQKPASVAFVLLRSYSTKRVLTALTTKMACLVTVKCCCLSESELTNLMRNLKNARHELILNTRLKTLKHVNFRYNVSFGSLRFHSIFALNFAKIERSLIRGSLPTIPSLSASFRAITCFLPRLRRHARSTRWALH